MRISDWSSDVCSSDLSTREWRAVASAAAPSPFARAIRTRIPHAAENVMSIAAINSRNQFKGNIVAIHRAPVVSEIEVETPSGILSAIVTTSSDRKSVVSGKSVSVRVDLGGRRIYKKKKE